MEENHYWFWLCNINGVGRITQRKLLEHFQSPKNIFDAEIEEISLYINRKSVIQKFLDSKIEEKIIHNYEMYQDKEIQFIHMYSKDYPNRLCCIPDAPISFYLKGSLPKENKKTVAIIGARDCTRYGREMARFFGRELSKAGVQIISGLARGIDGMAHEGALEANGYTMGVLGSGIDVVYPEENYQLFMQMEKRGGIVSESGMGIKPCAGLFPQRNRLIAGFADGILVVEAMERSGSFITVDQGLEQGKEIFALPGRNIDVKSRGCNNLIKMGAHIVTEVSDILEIIHCENTSAVNLAEVTDTERFVHKNLLAPNEKIVYSCLRVEPQYVDEIIHMARISPQEVCMALNHLVIIGGAVETTRNYYALKL